VNKVHTRPPVYGADIDKVLHAKVLLRMDNGIAIDNSHLRTMLVTLLFEYNLGNLLLENGGKNTFGDSWADRFFKRWNLVVRKATTKMRELPADYEAKKAEYVKIGAKKAEYIDETSVQFVPVAKQTRARKGA
jgi:hypothetical protein